MAAGVTGDYSGYGIEYVLFGAAVILVVILVFVAFIYYQKRQHRTYLLHKIREEWGKIEEREYAPAEFEGISHYYLNRKQDGFQIDDITWNDLDMDRVFLQMNHTRSFIGEGYLYYRLRTPSLSLEDLDVFESLVSWCGAHEREREELEYFFAQIGRNTNRYSVFDYLYNLPEADTGKGNWLHYGCILLLAVSVGMLFLYPQPGILLLCCSLAFSMSTYMNAKKPIAPYMISCKAVERILEAAEGIAKQEADWIPKKEIRAAVRSFGKMRRRMKLLTSGDAEGGGLVQAIAMYLNYMLHIDLIQFQSVVREAAKHMKDLEYLIDQIGRIESAIAVASFRCLHPDYVVPVLHEDRPICMKAENLYHPLITSPVANSVDTEKCLLLTGSNASGKSTFLKTAALAALLAQTVHTVTASSYEARYFRIYTSMALRDDLEAEESYFMVEIRSLKRILDRVEGEAPLLCCVDEVLRGTNTVERVAASSQILKWMAQKPLLCLAATHDIELTYILDGIYRNFHFEEQVTDEEVTFDYRLREGRAMTRNAIRLLHLMGFQDEIIREAEQMAEQLAEWPH